MADAEEAETLLRRWVELRAEVRKHHQRFKDQQERLRALEQEVPCLGSVKGTTRKKDGERAEIPEVPRPPKALPTPPASETPAEEKPPPKRPRKAAKKRGAAPLLKKARREVVELRAPTSKRSLLPPSPGTPRTRRSHVVGPEELSTEDLERLLRERRESSRRQTRAMTPIDEASTHGSVASQIL